MLNLLKIMAFPFVFSLIVLSPVAQVSAEDASMSPDAVMTQSDSVSNPDAAQAISAPAPKKAKKKDAKKDSFVHKMKQGARDVSNQAHLFAEKAPHRVEILKRKAANWKERAAHRAAMLKHKMKAAFHRKQAVFHSAQAEHHGKQVAAHGPQDDASMGANPYDSNADAGAAG